MLNQDGSQYHTCLRHGDVGRYVLLPGDPGRTDLIAASLNNARLVTSNREHRTWTGDLSGTPVSVTSTGMGGPSTAITVEELIRCGADTFIRVGTAGRVSDLAMDPAIDGVINTAAVRDEGTTSQYVPLAYPAVANRQIVAALAKAAEKLGYHYLEGITQSKDSFYGETEPAIMPLEAVLRERWEVWRRSHVLSSEMEASTLFVLSTVRGCRAGCIVSFGDIHKAVAVACDALCLLIAEDLL